jgi:hypothetical protein
MNIRNMKTLTQIERVMLYIIGCLITINFTLTVWIIKLLNNGYCF